VRFQGGARKVYLSHKAKRRNNVLLGKGKHNPDLILLTPEKKKLYLDREKMEVDRYKQQVRELKEKKREAWTKYALRRGPTKIRLFNKLNQYLEKQGFPPAQLIK